MKPIATFLLLELCIFMSSSASIEFETNPLIIGGSTAVVGEFPFMASIKLLKSDEFVCGASIIGHRWILTAAHCLESLGPPIFIPLTAYVVVGTVSRTQGGVAHNILDALTHPNYDPTTIASDIGLVKLVDNIKFDNHTQQIKLAKQTPAEHSTVTATGWGYTSNNNTTQPILLQKINLKTINTHRCGELIQINESEAPVCTLAPKGQGSCKFDSGGPLIYNNTLVGVSSSGPAESCANGHPDVYANVVFFHEWINKIIGNQTRHKHNIPNH